MSQVQTAEKEKENHSKRARESLRDRVKRVMVEHRLKQRDVAEATGLSQSVVSTWLAGKYDHAGDVVPAMRALVHRLAQGELFVETRNARLVWEAVDFACERRSMSLVIGHPGLGKTTGLKERYQRARRDGVEMMYVCANPAVRLNSLAKSLCRRLELPESGTAYDLTERLVAALRRRPVPLLLDEANHYNVACLEILRYLHDQVGLPIVLVGSAKLERTLSETGPQRLELEQLQSRIGLVVHLAPLDYGEVRRYLGRFEAEPHPDVVKDFARRSRGVVRDLRNGVENYRELKELNADALDRAVDPVQVQLSLVEAAFSRQLIQS